MDDKTNDHSAANSSPPDDDLDQHPTVARPDADPALPHPAIVGDTYTILLSGEDTAGRYCLIDIHVPPGGGPPPHGHDFEEKFTVLDDEIELTFRRETSVARSGETVNVPVNAPLQVENVSDRPARLLRMCSPAGQDEFFRGIGQVGATQTTPPAPLDEAAQAALMAESLELAPKCRSELLLPWPGGEGRRVPPMPRGGAGGVVRVAAGAAKPDTWTDLNPTRRRVVIARDPELDRVWIASGSREDRDAKWRRGDRPGRSAPGRRGRTSPATITRRHRSG